ncbi:MAG: hypothetical protein AAGA21_03865 [Pseudomonadota bacterium]
MRERYVTDIELTIESPFMFQGLAPTAFGIDASQMRLSEDGPITIPGTLIQGNIRAALSEIAEIHSNLVSQEQVLNWFGAGSDDAGVGDPPRRLVTFHDFHADTTLAEDPSHAVHRIAIDPNRGAVKHGALQIIEMPYAVGESVAFKGKMTSILTMEELQQLHSAVEVAFSCLPAIGAFKSIGFGKITHYRVHAARRRQASVPPSTWKARTDDALIAVLCFDRPFLVDADQVAGNVFVGKDIVPGSVIKGALSWYADVTGVRGAVPGFDDALTKIVIGHAFPIDKTSNDSPLPVIPAQPPLSLVSVPDGDQEYRLADVLVADGPCTFGGVVPGFSPWKSRMRPTPDPRSICGWSSVATSYDTRVRHKTNEESWASETADLFSLTAVRHDQHDWVCRIHRNGAEVDVFHQIIDVLAGGLESVGKTKASISCARIEPELKNSVNPLPNGLFAVTLQTDALLNDPAAIRRSPNGQHDYDDYWQNVSNGSLKLVRCFSRHRLAGGYLAMRHRREAGIYDPFLITVAGSVFLLEADDQGKNYLDQWAETGLPCLPSDPPLNWRTCPFVPENGFGAIRTNVVDHVTLGAGADVL